MHHLAMLMLLAAMPNAALQPGETKEAAAYGIRVERLANASDAAVWALQDVLTIKDPHTRICTRYLWIPPWGDSTWHQTNSFAVNAAASHSAVIRLPESASGGWLIRWDLRRLAPKESELEWLIVVWDSLAIGEPFFHIVLEEPVSCVSHRHIDGKTYKARRHWPAPHCFEAYSLLEKETQSFAPLLRVDDFERRLLSTIEGGRYYHFIGFIRNGQRLNETQILATVGLSVDLSRSVQGTDRVGIFVSEVTDKPRTVELAQGAIGRVRIANDIFDEDEDPSRHPFYNLLKFVEVGVRGKETIFDRANGLHAFAITDGKGNLVDVAPDNLVADHLAPRPATRRLFAGLSCIRCHSSNGGVQPCPNDVKTLLADADDFDVFDDLGELSKGRFENVDELAGLYAGDFDKRLREIRNDYADAVFRATRGLSTNKASEMLTKRYEDYWNAKVTPQRAALEVGFRVDAKDAPKFLNTILKRKTADIEIDSAPIGFDDPALTALKKGLSIRRRDWNRVYADAALRSQLFLSSH